MPGATPTATRRAVVERFAPIAMLATMMMATAAIQPPMSHDGLKPVFNMIATLLWIDVDELEMRRARGTAPAPAPASGTNRGGAAPSRFEWLERARAC